MRFKTFITEELRFDDLVHTLKRDPEANYEHSKQHFDNGIVTNINYNEGSIKVHSEYRTKLKQVYGDEHGLHDVYGEPQIGYGHMYKIRNQLGSHSDLLQHVSNHLTKHNIQHERANDEDNEDVIYVPKDQS